MELQMNQFRRQHGLAATREVKALSELARVRSETLSRTGQLIHTDSPSALLQKLQRRGLARSQAAENLLRQSPGRSAISEWGGRSVERSNLVNPDFQWHGLGKNAGKTGCYVVLLLTD
ncbi:MAG: hypothetical protein HS115_16695 [Spirochaetales bacterium]|nr:hypothetical protein [Spirochaetales bacterium]